MIEINLKGTYTEIGRQQGALLKQSGFQAETITSSSHSRIAFANACESIVAKHMPPIIDYIKGIADGGDFDYDRLKLLPLALAYGTPMLPSCTIAYIPSSYTKSRTPYFFRNYDWDYTSEAYFTMYRCQPTNAYESISFSDLYAGRYGGINTTGLMIAITSGRSYKGSWQPGCIMSLLTQWILDQYSNAKEAAAFLEQVPHCHGFNFLIADQDKNIARVAATPEKVHVELSHDAFVVQTNQFQSPEMKVIEDPALIPPSSTIRLRQVREWVAQHQGNITIDSIIDYCRTPIPEGGILEDDEYEGIKFGTIWSWNYDFAKKLLQVSSGNPSQTEYKTFSFP